MNIEFTSSLLSKFTTELIGENLNHKIKDLTIIPFYNLLDPNENSWHIEDGHTIWPIKTWKTNKARIDEVKRQADEYNKKIDLYKSLKESLIVGIVNKLLVTREMAELLAKDPLKGDRAMLLQFGHVFGIDLSNLPILDKPHIIIEGNKYYEL